MHAATGKTVMIYGQTEVTLDLMNARKAAGLNVEDRIALTLGGDGELLDAAKAHERYVTGETLATSVA